MTSPLPDAQESVLQNRELVGAAVQIVQHSVEQCAGDGAFRCVERAHDRLAELAPAHLRDEVNPFVDRLGQTDIRGAFVQPLQPHRDDDIDFNVVGGSGGQQQFEELLDLFLSAVALALRELEELFELIDEDQYFAAGRRIRRLHSFHQAERSAVQSVGKSLEIARRVRGKAPRPGWPKGVPQDEKRRSTILRRDNHRECGAALRRG